MTVSSSLPSAVTEASLLSALRQLSPAASLPGTDPEVQHFASGEEQLSTNPLEYLHWIDQLGKERLESPKSREVLRRSIGDLEELRKTAGLAAYAAAEAMQICLSDLALIEGLDGTDVPPATIKTLRDELVTQSIDLVNRLLRNMAMRAKTTMRQRSRPDSTSQLLGEVQVRAPASSPTRFDTAEPVLALVTAGRGTRLRSTLPKGLVPVGGVPMINRVVDAARQAGIRQVVFVVKYRAGIQLEYLARRGVVIVQDRAAGTAHSALAALGTLRGHRAPVVLSYSDQPFVTMDSFTRPLAAIRSTGADLIVSTIQAEGTELGRVVRNAAGDVREIVQPRLGGRGGSEADAGLYVVRCDRVLTSFSKIRNNNVRGEFNLPDVVAELVSAGRQVRTVTAMDEEFQSVNTPRDLALAQLRAATDRRLGAIADATAYFTALGASGQSPESIVAYGMERLMSLIGPVLDVRRSAE